MFFFNVFYTVFYSVFLIIYRARVHVIVVLEAVQADFVVWICCTMTMKAYSIQFYSYLVKELASLAYEICGLCDCIGPRGHQGAPQTATSA